MEYVTAYQNDPQRKPHHIYFQRCPEEYSPETSLEQCFRIFLISRGHGILNINNRSIPYFAPSILCINEKDTISFQQFPQETQILFFSPKFLNSNLDYHSIRQAGYDVPPAVTENRMLMHPFVRRKENFYGILNMGSDSFKKIKEIFSQIDIELNQQPTGWWPCRSRAFLSELLFFLGQYITTPASIKASSFNNISENTKNILNYICQNYNQKLQLEEVAALFATNRTSLNKIMKKTTGQSLIQYLIDLRMRNAALMFVDSELPVSDICSRVGIDDISHFERLFKKKYNMSPRNYRSKCRPK